MSSHQTNTDSYLQILLQKVTPASTVYSATDADSHSAMCSAFLKTLQHSSENSAHSTYNHNQSSIDWLQLIAKYKEQNFALPQKPSKTGESTTASSSRNHHAIKRGSQKGNSKVEERKHSEKSRNLPKKKKSSKADSPSSIEIIECRKSEDKVKGEISSSKRSSKGESVLRDQDKRHHPHRKDSSKPREQKSSGFAPAKASRELSSSRSRDHDRSSNKRVEKRHGSPKESFKSGSLPRSYENEYKRSRRSPSLEQQRILDEQLWYPSVSQDVQPPHFQEQQLAYMLPQQLLYQQLQAAYANSMLYPKPATSSSNDTLSTAVVRLSGELSDLKQELEAKNKECEEFQRDNQTFVGLVTKLNQSHVEEQEKRQKLELDLVKMESDLVKYKNEAVKYENDVSLLKVQLHQANLHIGELRDKLKDKEKLITNLKFSIETQKETNKTMKSTLYRKNEDKKFTTELQEKQEEHQDCAKNYNVAQEEKLRNSRFRWDSDEYHSYSSILSKSPAYYRQILVSVKCYYLRYYFEISKREPVDMTSAKRIFAARQVIIWKQRFSGLKNEDLKQMLYEFLRFCQMLNDKVTIANESTFSDAGQKIKKYWDIIWKKYERHIGNKDSPTANDYLAFTNLTGLKILAKFDSSIEQTTERKKDKQQSDGSTSVEIARKEQENVVTEMDNKTTTQLMQLLDEIEKQNAVLNPDNTANTKNPTVQNNANPASTSVGQILQANFQPASNSTSYEPVFTGGQYQPQSSTAMVTSSTNYANYPERSATYQQNFTDTIPPCVNSSAYQQQQQQYDSQQNSRWPLLNPSPNNLAGPAAGYVGHVEGYGQHQPSGSKSEAETAYSMRPTLLPHPDLEFLLHSLSPPPPPPPLPVPPPLITEIHDPTQRRPTLIKQVPAESLMPPDSTSHTDSSAAASTGMVYPGYG